MMKLNPIPTYHDDSPFNQERFAQSDAMTINLPAPTFDGLTFTIDAKGEHIATAWAVYPKAMPDVHAQTQILKRERKAYFTEGGALCPTLLQAALYKAYQALSEAERINAANPTPENYAKVDVMLACVWPIREALIVCPSKSIRDLYARAVAFCDDALGDMELNDIRSLQCLLRDIKALAGEA